MHVGVCSSPPGLPLSAQLCSQAQSGPVHWLTSAVYVYMCSCLPVCLGAAVHAPCQNVVWVMPSAPASGAALGSTSAGYIGVVWGLGFAALAGAFCRMLHARCWGPCRMLQAYCKAHLFPARRSWFLQGGQYPASQARPVGQGMCRRSLCAGSLCCLMLGC